MMKVAKIVGTAAIAGALILGGALVAPTAAQAVDATSNPSPNLTRSVAATGQLGVLRASFDLSRVALTDGHAAGAAHGDVSAIPAQISASTTGAYQVEGDTRLGWGATGIIQVGAAYQITMLGAPTGYWIFARMQEYENAPAGYCDVYLGDPAVAGSAVASPSPFTCNSAVTQGYPVGLITFSVALNRAAEAQGVINTQGPISLESGHYEPNVPYHVDGSANVGENSSTSFDVVLRDGDTPIVANLAKSVFVYRVVEAGVERPFWVAGWSQNYRGTTKFSPEAKCAVYDQDPVKALGGLDTLKPADVSPYDCEKTSEQFVDYRGNYQATFTVTKRAMTIVTQPLEQKELAARVCATIANCGLSLATVTPTYGAGRPVSAVVNNPTGEDVTHSISTSGSETITNSGGFEIDVTAGAESPLGYKFETTLKTHYERSVAEKTTTTETIGTTIPPHMRGWIEGTPPMIHTEGEIIVRDGDRYYDLTNVVVDFPDADGKWEYTARTEALPPTQLTQAVLNGSIHTTNGVNSPSELSLIDGTYSLPLTSIGAVASTSTPGATTVGAESSTQWTTTNQVTDPVASGGAVTNGSFTYQIADGGIPTGFWITGTATTSNHDGSPSASCIVYKGNPTLGGAPVQDAPYQCRADVAPADPNGVVEVTYTVSPALALLTPAAPPIPVVSADAATPVTPDHGTLANTGSTTDLTPYLAASFATLLGAGLIFARRRREARGRTEDN